jgi:hypothetical protein
MHRSAAPPYSNQADQAKLARHERNEDRVEKEIKGKWVLHAKHVLASPMEIGSHSNRDEPALRALAAKHGMKVTGPLEHAYWNMSIPGVPHVLEIWLPIGNQEGHPSIEGLKFVEPYKCFTSVFRGRIEEIGDAWMELGVAATKAGCSLTHHDREVYRRLDWEHPENNDIELQMGVR